MASAVMSPFPKAVGSSIILPVQTFSQSRPAGCLPNGPSILVCEDMLQGYPLVTLLGPVDPGAGQAWQDPAQWVSPFGRKRIRMGLEAAPALRFALLPRVEQGQGMARVAWKRGVGWQPEVVW